jgi:hypothetical protein
MRCHIVCAGLLSYVKGRRGRDRMVVGFTLGVLDITLCDKVCQ